MGRLIHYCFYDCSPAGVWLSCNSTITKPVNREKLKEWREQHDLSQQELAELLGVYFMTISRWERGIQKIPPFLGLALQQLHTNLTTKPRLKLVDRN